MPIDRTAELRREGTPIRGYPANNIQQTVLQTFASIGESDDNIGIAQADSLAFLLQLLNDFFPDTSGPTHSGILHEVDDDHGVP